MLRDGIERFLARFRCMRVDWMRDVVLRTLTNLDNGRPPRRHVRGGDLRQLEAPYFFEVYEAPPFVFTRSGPVPRREETIEQRIARIRRGDVTDEERVALARLGPIEDQEGPRAIDEAELVEEARADAEEKDLAPCKCGRRPEYVEGEVKGASYGCYRCGRCEVEGTYTAGHGREAAARLY